MANGKFVAYYRVSTAKQGESGLGLDGQRDAVRTYLNGGRWQLVGEHTEVESGARNDRPALAAALADCQLYGATLVISRLDRLSRDAHFLLGLQKAGVDFVAVDLPSANRMTIGIMAIVAEEERRMISARTKTALAAAKARGTVLGGDRGGRNTAEDRAKAVAAIKAKADDRADRIAPLVRQLVASGMSLNRIAEKLNADGIATARGGRWQATSVKRVLDRAE